MLLTQKRLKELLDYNHSTGIFTWKVRRNQYAVKGAAAGTLNKNNYIQITIDGQIHYAHRLVFLFLEGHLPEGIVDHLDGNPSNNCIENLRVCSDRDNASNKQRHREGSLVGAYWSKTRNKFVSQIKIQGKSRHLGQFDTAIEAHTAYLKALNEFQLQA
jgi:hypothetical protein